MTSRRSNPRPIALALEGAQEAWAPESLLAEAQRAWPAAVGNEIAEQAAPSRERAGVLTISCAASVWAHELELMGPKIVERLNRQLQSGQIVKLRGLTRSLPDIFPEPNRDGRW